MQIKGSIKVIGKEQQVSEKFRKREFVVTDNSSQYPQHISFQLTQDKCSMLDGYKPGDIITVHFNLRGREWTSPQGEIKYFNTLEAWRIERSGSESSYSQETPDYSDIPAGKDDLPF
ncbi:MAG: DUF3127 domain-containing protein [Bacteroidetes bacterium]|nr:MAG: DUF3127 domain-containing protein [Bacteroidota bacterium]REK00041.1 MAG: DUF3127 domain-containing protein [Bacteroidota bacterium]REK35778.1 MAG: DUF3127 domain-containing protein [Bacteroidota bacterium]REK49349.1 MAG: DUF3127 domain-containing protein [Bacteroidota bacterium]